MSTTSQPTVAFFGATGGCTVAALSRAIEAGCKCTALARTPSKLEKLLSERKVSADKIKSNLTIIQGDVKNVDDVARTLKNGDATADVAISGIGAYPKMQWSLTQPITLTDPTVCTEATKVYVSAMDRVYGAGKGPHFVMVSTTGISSKARDVPLALYPLYKYTLQVPHKDKEDAEQILVEQMKAGRAVTSVRASLLMDGPSKGLDAVREGWEWGAKEASADESPAVGYTIAREDVGLWIFERLINGGAASRSEWAGKMATVTS